LKKYRTNSSVEEFLENLVQKWNINHKNLEITCINCYNHQIFNARSIN
jgi:ribosomal protein S27E